MSANSYNVSIGEEPIPQNSQNVSKSDPLSWIEDIAYHVIKIFLNSRKAKTDDSRSNWARDAFMRAYSRLRVMIATLLLFAIIFPFFISYIVFTGEVDWMDDRVKRLGERLQQKQTYQRSNSKMKPAKKSLLRFGLVPAARLGILVLVWLPINLSVPTLRGDVKLLGTLLWKWSVLAAVILLLTPAILLFAYILTAILRYDIEHNKNVYWIRGVENGVRRVLYFAAILLAWSSFFFADYDKIKKTYRSVHKYIILTLVALLIGAILGLLNDIVVLWWKWKIIYTAPNKKKIMFSAFVLLDLSKHFKKPPESDENDIVFSLQDIDEVAEWLTKWIDEPHKYSKMEDNLDDFPLDEKKFSEHMLQLDDKDNNVNASNNNLHAKFGNQMTDPHKICCTFKAKLQEDFKLKNILKTILTVVQVAIAFLVWLFITELATTRLVLTLGSLFVGLTFVFSDTCKTFFQGCIFSFLTRPLNVGDVVVEIDGKPTKLVVKTINVMATIFTIQKPENGDKSDKIVFYPNSKLATKTIMKEDHEGTRIGES